MMTARDSMIHHSMGENVEARRKSREPGYLDFGRFCNGPIEALLAKGTRSNGTQEDFSSP